MLKDVSDAYYEVVKCLNDEADRVRATVLQFIKKYNKEEAASAMLEQLENENVQYNILIILELFRKWTTRQALPVLERHIKEDWVFNNSELLTSYKKTIKKLKTSTI